MEKLDSALSTLIDKLQAAGFEQAPEVIAGAIRAIYWDGMIQLGTFIFFTTIFTICIALLFTGLFSKRLKESDNDEPAIGIGGIIGLLSLILMFIAGLTNNPWLKVFDPQAAFYQQIMKGIL